MLRARCDNWKCLHCGPRKVDLWRQLVQAAEPTHFVTLTKVGWTLKEAARVLTTVLQYLRRGSKGYGPDHVGARPAYPIEFFADCFWGYLHSSRGTRGLGRVFCIPGLFHQRPLE